MIFSLITLLSLSVSARIRQTDRLPIDVEEWINQANERGEISGDWQRSKYEVNAEEEESNVLPPDVGEWINQINQDQNVDWPSKADAQVEAENLDILPMDVGDTKTHSCCQSKMEKVENEKSDILPDDIAEWIEQVNREDSGVDLPSKLDIYSDSDVREASDVGEQDAEQSNDLNRLSDCSIVVTLWKKMGKETVLDPRTVSPTGCCMTSKESDFDHVRCEGDRVMHIDWRYSHLQGGIPEEFGSLQNLKELYLSENDLTGSIPAAISTCKSLMYLDLSDNNLSGGIPPEMGNMANLGYLFVWNNNLQGDIPDEFGLLEKLVSFGVSGNPNLNTDVLPAPLQERKDTWNLWLW